MIQDISEFFIDSRSPLWTSISTTPSEAWLYQLIEVSIWQNVLTTSFNSILFLLGGYWTKDEYQSVGVFCLGWQPIWFSASKRVWSPSDLNNKEDSFCPSDCRNSSTMLLTTHIQKALSVWPAPAFGAPASGKWRIPPAERSAKKFTLWL